MAQARSRVVLKRDPAIHVSRISVGSLKLAYVILADKKIRYEKGQSFIVYIGTTKNGIDRVATSVAYRSEQIFSTRGVRSFNVKIVTCTPRKQVATWKLLERALLIQFRSMYGEPPLCNSHGKRMRVRDEYHVFSKDRIRAVLKEMG